MTITLNAQHKHGHIFMFAYNFYGHHKPLCTLMSIIIRKRPVNVTYLVSDQLYEKILKELSRHFEPGEEELLARIRVITYEAGDGMDFPRADKSANEIYKRLVTGQPVAKAPGSDDTFTITVPPTFAIIDSLAGGVREYIHTVSNRSVKVLGWNSPAASALVVAALPKEQGGWFGDLDAQLKEHEERGVTGNELIKIAEEIYVTAGEELRVLPGGLTMFEYEWVPQITPLGRPNALRFRHVYQSIANVDGLILMSSPHVEGPLINAFKDYYNPRPVLTVAPLLPPTSETEIRASRKDSAVFRETEAFLDNALSKHGPKSVVYFSFGSTFWCLAPEKLWTFLDVLEELKIPVLFAHASPMAVIPDEVKRKLDESELIYHSTWLPQQMILRHAATGWFVTHGGHNSVTESLSEGVPMICWPLFGDQPLNTAWLTHHGLAYELFEVRSGEFGLLPVHRLGRAPEGTVEALKREVQDVFAKAFGEDGAEKRRKVLEMKERLAEGWKEGGHCWNEIDRLLEFGGL